MDICCNNSISESSQIEFWGLYNFIHPQKPSFDIISTDNIDTFLRTSIQYTSKEMSIPEFLFKNPRNLLNACELLWSLKSISENGLIIGIKHSESSSHGMTILLSDCSNEIINTFSQDNLR